MIITPETFFSPVVEQGVLDYRTMPEGDEKQRINQFFLEHFQCIPDMPLEFVKIDGFFYYKTHWQKRIPLQIASWIKVVSLDNIPFHMPG
jgi:hypothetical protein